MDEQGEDVPGTVVELVPPGVTIRNGRWYVRRSITRRGAEGEQTAETQDTGEIEIQPFVGPVAQIGCKYGVTIQTQPFESARIDVWLTLPAYAGEIDDAYKFVSDWVGTRVARERDDIEAQVKASGEAEG